MDSVVLTKRTTTTMLTIPVKQQHDSSTSTLFWDDDFVVCCDNNASTSSLFTNSTHTTLSTCSMSTIDTIASSVKEEEKCVHFKPRVKFQEIPNRHSYTKKQLRKIYWSPLQVKLLKTKYKDDQEDLSNKTRKLSCTLGIVTRDVEARNKTSRKYSHMAVFVEQERQWAKAVYEPTQIAMACNDCTKQSQNDALQRAADLAKELDLA